MHFLRWVQLNENEWLTEYGNQQIADIVVEESTFCGSINVSVSAWKTRHSAGPANNGLYFGDHEDGVLQERTTTKKHETALEILAEIEGRSRSGGIKSN
jgi:hypothetical protein